jgi:hypothetical protein
MDRLPFSGYDFFGYLASGFLLLVTSAVALDQERLLGKSPAAPLLLTAIVIAYVLGHVIAHLSGYLLENTLARRVLGPPERLLLAPGSSRGLRHRLFAGYFEPLPDRVRERAMQTSRARGWGEADRGHFLQALEVARHDPIVATRLESFLNLYGFARNTAMALILCAGELGLGALASSSPAKGFWACAALLTALVLFFRYLKFYRLYTAEVFFASLETS